MIGASVYVVDKNYRIVYFNEYIKELYPGLKGGEYCYQALCHEEAPCSYCPLLEENRDEALFFNPFLKTWIHINVTDVRWPDIGTCHLMVAGRVKGRASHKMHEAALRMAEVPGTDRVGILGKNTFCDVVTTFLGENPQNQYCLVAIDIEHFKLFNEWYGTEKGDCFLREFSAKLTEVVHVCHGFAGYFGNDDFYILMRDDQEDLKWMQEEVQACFENYDEEVRFLPVFGVFSVENPSLPVSAMCDRARIAAESLKGNYVKRFAYFEPAMIQKMEDEHHLLARVREGLKKGEFTVYFQPQCRIGNGTVAGAEALVRWKRNEKTIESPDSFIPVLEKNGFIAMLDRYVWEEVCKWMRSLLDRGCSPVPISLNVSHVDIFTMDVAEYLVDLTEKYQIPHSYLEVEITESAYAEEFGLVDETAQALRKSGFKVLLDDFGSGYSSLNMLKDLNIDVLKLDMKFLDINAGNARKGIGILESVINMARRMTIPIIAEGVSNEEQLDFLQAAGCRYAQGYYFYHPMPAEEFANLLMDKDKVDHGGIRFKRAEMLHVREFLDENVFSDSMLNALLGAVAFYDFHEDVIEVVRYNEQYYQITGGSSVDDDSCRQFLLASVYEEDHAAFWRLADEAYRKQRTGAQMDFRYVRADNTRIWFHIHLMYLQEKDGHRLFYASLSRATELEKRFLNEKLLSTLQMASLNSWEWDLQKNELKVINTSGQEEFAKISSKLIKDRNVFPFSAETMFEKHLIEPGYEPEVRKHVFHIFECSDQERVAFDIPFRLRDGGKLWLTFTGQVHCAPDGRPVRVIGFYKNITESRKKDEELQRKAEHDALTGLYNRYYAVPWIEDYLKSHNAKQSALAMIDLDHFKDINDTFGHVRGDEVITDIARKVEKVFRESDIVCRMGGDEFMIFCGNIREKDFEKQLQNAIDTLQLSVRENDREIMVSVSVGYVLLHQSDGSFSDLYEKADQALLKAKDLGKNRFVRYDIG